MNTEAEMTAGAATGWRYWISGHRRMWWLAGILILGGVALGWNWLVAIGAAPLLLAVLPCAAMCALGLCMNHKSGGACDQTTSETKEKST